MQYVPNLQSSRLCSFHQHQGSLLILPSNYLGWSQLQAVAMQLLLFLTWLLNIFKRAVKMVSTVCSWKKFLQGPWHWINIGKRCGPISSLNFNKIHASDTLLLLKIVLPINSCMSFVTIYISHTKLLSSTHVTSTLVSLLLFTNS